MKRPNKYWLAGLWEHVDCAEKAQDVLDWMKSEGYSPRTIARYYHDLKATAKGIGVNTSTWPKGPRIPRTKSREPITEADAKRITQWLRTKGWADTADLCHLISTTGLRPKVEALTGSLNITKGVDFDTIRLAGKGGDEREIPVKDLKARTLLCNGGLDTIRETAYRTHAERLQKAVEALGVTSKSPTLHAFRHTFATRLYEKSKDPVLVKELLGHADLNTTNGYIGKRDLGEVARGFL